MKRFSLISLSIISLVIILAHYAQASIHFQQFNINDYSKEQLPREELVKEIQTFVVRTLPKIENCNERGEGEFQSIFCTNIYEADRIRLAYILGYNANLKPEAITKTNHVRKLIFPANAKIYNENLSLKEENGDGNVTITILMAVFLIHTKLKSNLIMIILMVILNLVWRQKLGLETALLITVANPKLA